MGEPADDPEFAINDLTVFHDHGSLGHSSCHVEINKLELVAQSCAVKFLVLVRSVQVRFHTLFWGQILETLHTDLPVASPSKRRVLKHFLLCVSVEIRTPTRGISKPAAIDRSNLLGQVCGIKVDDFRRIRFFQTALSRDFEHKRKALLVWTSANASKKLNQICTAAANLTPLLPREVKAFGEDSASSRLAAGGFQVDRPNDGAGRGNRTPDQRFTKPLLYR